MANVATAAASSVMQDQSKETEALDILLKCFSSYDKSILQPYRSQSYVLVETREQLARVCSELEPYSIVGVDLENNHHDSYNGFTCLI